MPFDPNYGFANDEDLLALAKKAGYIQDSPQEPNGDPTVDMEGDTDTDDVHRDYHQWVPAQLGQDSNYTTDGTTPQSPVPGTASGAPQPPIASVSQSGRGFSIGKYGQVSQTDAELNNDLQSAEDEASARQQRMITPFTNAAEAKIKANQDFTKASIDEIHGQAEQALVMQRLQDEFGVEEARANAEAQAQSNKAKAGYLQSLADFRASRVDPSQLWSNMGGGARFGMLVAAFTQDFLGAKGIKTSAMDTFNKAIDRNIDSQIQAIKVKGEVAEGFKSLWYMQRNQSASDAEARARVRGFLLEGAKQAVIANMAQYQAGLATAQGQKALADIDAELAKNLMEVYRHSDANAVALRNQAIDKWKTKIMAAQESWANAIRSQEVKNNAQKGIKMPEPIIDPETGQAKWIYRPEIQDKEREETRNLTIETANVSDKLNELRKLSRQMDGILDPIQGTRFAGTLHTKFNALATLIAHSMAKANSERATDQDVLDFLKGMREKTTFTKADVDEVLAFTQENLIKPVNNRIRVVGMDITPEIAQAMGIPGAANQKAFEGTSIDAHNTSEPPAETPQQARRRQAEENLGQERANETVGDANSQVQRIHKELAKQYPDAFATKKIDIKYGNADFGTGRTEQGIRGFEKGLVEVYNMANEGDPAAKEELARYARGYLSGVTTLDNDPQGAMAAYLMGKLED